jgi:phenylalanyl-tRNA synthetase beta chain
MWLHKQWLHDFVDIADVSAQELADKLTAYTVEIEGVRDQQDALARICVGEVVSAKKHPNADALFVCQVSTGKETFQVVCGGSNVSEGMKVAFAKSGATVRWHGHGDLVELGSTRIRGEESNGMICAADEIGLDHIFPKESEKEILDLTHVVTCDLGIPLVDALDADCAVLDIDNKSMTHRPDLWGHYGIAREVATLFMRPLAPYPNESFDNPSDPSWIATITVKDADACPRYMGVVMHVDAIGSSPDWMQKRLVQVGINPINTVVDITNYVMLELGQPMHAFDATALAGKKQDATIVVRRAKKGESITTLGGDEHALSKDMLVIANGKHPVAVAGVKGGEHSGVKQDTRVIFFEAANFEPLSVRRTASALGLRTDSSSRFEKGLDPQLVQRAMNRAVSLMKELCPGATVVSESVDVTEPLSQPKPISVSLNTCQSIISPDISTEFIEDTLTRLGFGVVVDKDLFSVTPPSWRATGDISIPEDIVEEVARMYGYANIQPTLPSFEIKPAPKDPQKMLLRDVTTFLAREWRYTNTLNVSFVSPELLAMLNIPMDKYIELANPLAKDQPLLRRNLIPNLLRNVENNLHRFDEVRLFEIGRVYLSEKDGELAHPNKKERLPYQPDYLGLVYAQKGNDEPFIEAMSVVRSVLMQLGVDASVKSMKADASMIHPGRYAALFASGVEIGRVAELHPLTQEKLGIPYRTGMAQLYLNDVSHARTNAHAQDSAYVPLPLYPSVMRDIAFVTDRDARHEELRSAIIAKDPLIQDVALFDVYTGSHVPDGKKSMAYHVTYMSNEKTLKAKDVDEIHATVIQMLVKNFGADVRS